MAKEKQKMSAPWYFSLANNKICSELEPIQQEILDLADQYISAVNEILPNPKTTYENMQVLSTQGYGLSEYLDGVCRRPSVYYSVLLALAKLEEQIAALEVQPQRSHIDSSYRDAAMAYERAASAYAHSQIIIDPKEQCEAWLSATRCYIKGEQFDKAESMLDNALLTIDHSKYYQNNPEAIKTYKEYRKEAEQYGALINHESAFGQSL